MFFTVKFTKSYYLMLTPLVTLEYSFYNKLEVTIKIINFLMTVKHVH